MLQEEAMSPFHLVASGHAANGGSPLLTLQPQRDKPGKSQVAVLLKPFDATEHNVYRAFEQAPDDPIHEFIPRFHGIVQCSTKKFISISNLAEEFHNPVVMDVKLGTRTFLESECTKQELRPDLFARMTALYPGDITSEEQAAKAITKYRWMTLRDSKSTTRSLGYRIDGIAGCSAHKRQAIQAQLKHTSSREQAQNMFQNFADESGAPDNIVRNFRSQLRRLRTALENSEFFGRHECIGTSILLVADATGRTGTFWIDFAKTQALEESQTISHRSVFELGNREDGVLFGLDNLIDLWDDLLGSNQRCEGGYPTQHSQANPQEGDAKTCECDLVQPDKSSDKRGVTRRSSVQPNQEFGRLSKRRSTL